MYAFACASIVALTFDDEIAAKPLPLKLEPEALTPAFTVASTSSVAMPVSTLA